MRCVAAWAALISSNIVSLETHEEAGLEKLHRLPKVTQLEASEPKYGSRLQVPACCPCLGARGSQDAVGCSFPLLFRGPCASRKQMQARVSSRPAVGHRSLCLPMCKWRPMDKRAAGGSDMASSISCTMLTRLISETLSMSFPFPVPLPDSSEQVQAGMACDQHVGQVPTVAIITTWNLLPDIVVRTPTVLMGTCWRRHVVLLPYRFPF